MDCLLSTVHPTLIIFSLISYLKFLLPAVTDSPSDCRKQSCHLEILPETVETVGKCRASRERYSAVQCRSTSVSVGTCMNGPIYSDVWYCTVQSSVVEYSEVQYSTVQYITVQCNTVEYSTVHCSTVQSKVQQSNWMFRWVRCMS